MSRFQELIVAAVRVCELEEQGATAPAIMAAIGRLRTAVGNVRARGEETFETFSGVNLKNEAFVELRGPALPATMPAATAVELGRYLIEAAATAETEAALVAELREHGVTNELLAAILGGMRRRRSGTD